jgi:2-keto-4-pentenoate hydratase/2-oxohepta-3-ene-1,7-dioic acid hydratase in catechol pathway
MWLDVNGERRQRGSTSTMIFSMAKCISYVSQFMTLLPGDIITTGTPPGVGTGMKPPQFLNAGDVVTLGIEGLGEQRQENRRGVSQFVRDAPTKLVMPERWRRCNPVASN